MTINRSILTLFAAIVLLFTFVACKKKDASPTDTALLKAFFDKNAPKTETFTFTASQNFTVTTSKGTTIDFPANVLLDETRKPVTGTVEVNIKEIQTVSDMLFSDKPTTGDVGQMLISFGELKIDATQNGQKLRLRDTTYLHGIMNFVGNAGQIREILMWKGDTTPKRIQTGLNSEGIFTTVTTDIPALKGVIWVDMNLWVGIIPSTNKVNFAIDKLGEWRNCDVFMNDVRPKTTVLGYFSNHFSYETLTTYEGLAPTNLFFKPKGQNTLVKLYSLIVAPMAGKEGFYSALNTIPIGLEGTFLAISTIGGKFYADMKDVTIAAPASGKTFTGITFSPVEITEADLLAKITSLNSK